MSIYQKLPNQSEPQLLAGPVKNSNGGSSRAEWGHITGDLQNQEDLQGELNTKISTDGTIPKIVKLDSMAEYFAKKASGQIDPTVQYHIPEETITSYSSNVTNLVKEVVLTTNQSIVDIAGLNIVEDGYEWRVIIDGTVSSYAPILCYVNDITTSYSTEYCTWAGTSGGAAVNPNDGRIGAMGINYGLIDCTISYRSGVYKSVSLCHYQASDNTSAVQVSANSRTVSPTISKLTIRTSDTRTIQSGTRIRIYKQQIDVSVQALLESIAIENNLSSSDTSKALAAPQGKILDDKITAVNTLQQGTQTISSGFSLNTTLDNLLVKKLDGMVTYYCLITGTIPATTWTKVATLPAGFRPRMSKYFAALNASINGATGIRIEATGEVFAYSQTATNNVSIDTTFLAGN